ncbi:hypothetical protein OVY01_14410 [Robbsia sp. Bb-Pol-6]|uniref:DUF5808 domain-containing protein n=1 Tax=Robbsia betulipollinis TaxID=2981849 RepID=A0ABT3ZPR9_9BURK|nr:hypothetical protein [Robbsia betulipollinis]MCY0388402.1 hypothetical protein [Robbsia betulipollinis]
MKKMWQRARGWYEGEGKATLYDNDPDSGVFIMPSFHTEYHWTATVARSLVNFYGLNWQFMCSTIIALVGIYLAYRALK